MAKKAMSEETKQKLRDAAAKRKAKADPSPAASVTHNVPTDESWDSVEATPPAHEEPSLQASRGHDFDAIVRKHPSHTLRQLYAMKINSMSKAEAFAEAIKQLS